MIPTSEPARSMWLMDEPMRNALIGQCDNCLDGRKVFERAALDNVTVSMPYQYFDGDDYA